MPSWSEILKEVNAKQDDDRFLCLDKKRTDFIKEIANHTNRNVIAYYSGWLQKPNLSDSAINDKDINAFMEAVYKMDKSKGLDLILHTPGGEIAATEKVIDYLHSIFSNDIRAIIPQMAMSAGSMIAVSCKEVIMGKQSCLGPFDPQFGGIACQSVLKEFEKAKQDVQNNPHSLGLWQVIISKYHPTFIESCRQAVELTNELADTILTKSISNANKISKIKKAFNNNDETKVHSRHISKEKCKEVGLNICDMEADSKLQDLILSLHHCYMISFEQLPTIKMIENNIGGCYMTIINSQ